MLSGPKWNGSNIQNTYATEHTTRSATEIIH